MNKLQKAFLAAIAAISLGVVAAIIVGTPDVPILQASPAESSLQVAQPTINTCTQTSCRTTATLIMIMTSSANIVYTSATSGIFTVANGIYARPSSPSIQCTEDGCFAQSANVEEVQKLLDLIASRSLRVDVMIASPDAYCHVRHEFIEPRPAEVVAALDR